MTASARSCILLRKFAGRLAAFFRNSSGPSFAGAALASVERFLFSPIVLAVLVIALALAWIIAHPVHAAYATPLALAIGTTAAHPRAAAPARIQVGADREADRKFGSAGEQLA